jgi:hypothetical protein
VRQGRLTRDGTPPRPSSQPHGGRRSPHVKVVRPRFAAGAPPAARCQRSGNGRPGQDRQPLQEHAQQPQNVVPVRHRKQRPQSPLGDPRQRRRLGKMSASAPSTTPCLPPSRVPAAAQPTRSAGAGPPCRQSACSHPPVQRSPALWQTGWRCSRGSRRQRSTSLARHHGSAGRRRLPRYHVTGRCSGPKAIEWLRIVSSLDGTAKARPGNRRASSVSATRSSIRASGWPMH